MSPTRAAPAPAPAPVLRSSFSVTVADRMRQGVTISDALIEVLGGITDGSGPRTSDVVADLIDMGVYHPNGSTRTLPKEPLTHGRSGNGSTGVMLTPSHNAAVVNFLAEMSLRPLVAMRVWALALVYRRDDGEIMLSRQQIAEAVGDTPDHISTIIGELVSFGAVLRQMETVVGMRGRGRVRYFVNSNVATSQTVAPRKKAKHAQDR